MLLCGSQSLICKCFNDVGCKFSVGSKQLSCETPQDIICRALRGLVVIAEVENDNTIRRILDVLNDFSTNDAFALISAR